MLALIIQIITGLSVCIVSIKLSKNGRFLTGAMNNVSNRLSKELHCTITESVKITINIDKP